jgi:hypothetical protein
MSMSSVANIRALAHRIRRHTASQFVLLRWMSRDRIVRRNGERTSQARRRYVRQTACGNFGYAAFLG